jgi:acyl-CoA synthetase (AMP-forming)/AMP-acid ligase II
VRRCCRDSRTLLAQGRIARVARVLYGSTEAEPIASLSAAELVQTSAESTDPLAGLCAGTPVPEIALRIVRAHDGPIELGTDGWRPWELPRGEAGEVVVSGEHVLRGYLDDPESDRANKIRDGETVWHRTGDGGRLDETGRLWLLGRVSRRVRRGGATWWGLPPELRATTLPEISHAAYVGRPDSCWASARCCASSSRPATELGASLSVCSDGCAITGRRADRPRAHSARSAHASKTDYEALARRLEQPSTS